MNLTLQTLEGSRGLHVWRTRPFPSPSTPIHTLLSHLQCQNLCTNIGDQNELSLSVYIRPHHMANSSLMNTNINLSLTQAHVPHYALVAWRLYYIMRLNQPWMDYLSSSFDAKSYPTQTALSLLSCRRPVTSSLSGALQTHTVYKCT